MRWSDELKVYGQHVLALFRPNAPAPVHEADLNQPGNLNGWKSQDLRILIEEGRRQIDRQHDDLERIRARSQILLAFGLALVGTTAALDERVAGADSLLVRGVWILALAAGAWSILGAAATSVVRADMEVVHAAVLSRRTPPVEPGLAADYAQMVMTGENQLATRLTNLRHAVTWLLVAAVLALVTWVASSPESKPTHKSPHSPAGITKRATLRSVPILPELSARRESW
jgi:hypothetical protein